VELVRRDRQEVDRPARSEAQQTAPVVIRPNGRSDLGGGHPEFGAGERIRQHHDTFRDTEIADGYGAAERSDLQTQCVGAVGRVGDGVPSAIDRHRVVLPVENERRRAGAEREGVIAGAGGDALAGAIDRDIVIAVADRKVIVVASDGQILVAVAGSGGVVVAHHRELVIAATDRDETAVARQRHLVIAVAEQHGVVASRQRHVDVLAAHAVDDDSRAAKSDVVVLEKARIERDIDTSGGAVTELIGDRVGEDVGAPAGRRCIAQVTFTERHRASRAAGADSGQA